MVYNEGPIGHCVPVATPEPIDENINASSTFDTPSSSIIATTSTTIISSAAHLSTNLQQSARSAQLSACSSEKCLNGGTCYGFSTNYTCICAKGYKGLSLLQILLTINSFNTITILQFIKNCWKMLWKILACEKFLKGFKIFFCLF